MTAGKPAPDPGRARLLSVGELARAIQGVLDEGLDGLWVVGELSNFRVSPPGHCYFTLKDATAQISAVMFRGDTARLRFRPADGLEVIAFGRVKLYETRGALQLYVQSLEPRGLGALRQHLEKLREKLAAEGLLDVTRKRPLPYLPACIGIVTALGGAAIRDMLRMLRDRYPERRIVVRSVRVQGVGAEHEIAQGIRDLQGIGEVEVIVVGRGGGSIEDLWAFNDEEVARAIVASRVPVVSAVGHEIDVTIADLVADVRAATPSAAAELVLPKRRDLEDTLCERRRALVASLERALTNRRRALDSLAARLRDPRRDLVLGRARLADAHHRLLRVLARAIAVRRDRVAALQHRLQRASPGRAVLAHRQSMLERRERLETCARRALEVARARFGVASAALSGLSPLAVLARGYAVVWKRGDRRALRSAAEAAPGEEVDIRLYHGSLRAKVTKTIPEGSTGGSSEGTER